MRIVLPTTYRFEAKSERTKGEAHTLFPGLRKHPPNLSPSLSANSTHKNERTRVHTHTFSHFSSFPAPCDPFFPVRPNNQRSDHPLPFSTLPHSLLSSLLPAPRCPLHPHPGSHLPTPSLLPSSSSDSLTGEPRPPRLHL